MDKKFILFFFNFDSLSQCIFRLTHPVRLARPKKFSIENISADDLYAVNRARAFSRHSSRWLRPFVEKVCHCSNLNPKTGAGGQFTNLLMRRLVDSFARIFYVLIGLQLISLFICVEVKVRGNAIVFGNGIAMQEKMLCT